MKREAESSVSHLEEEVKDPNQKLTDEVKEEEANDQVKQSEENKHEFKKLPTKIRVAMIAGYNGSDFSGSQK